MDFTLLKEALISGTMAATLVKPLIDVYITPKLQELKDKGKLKDVGSDTLEEYFEKYLTNAFEARRKITSIVFAEQSRELAELYIPMTIRQNEGEFGRDGNGEEPCSYTLATLEKELLKQYPKLLITDTAGMGKSTALNWLFLSCVNSNLGYPVFLNLRRLDEKGVVHAILEELKLIDQPFDEDLLRCMLAQGNFIFFLDGYDEIPYDKRKGVTKDLAAFINKTSKNKFIMTSRPEPDLCAFPGFTIFHIEPLEIEQAKELIHKYDASEGKALSELLYEEIDAQAANSQLMGYLENPLLTSLLFMAFAYNRTLSEQMSNFYSSVYDALFFKHDRFKGDSFEHGKRSALSKDDFEKVLRYIAFHTFRKAETEYSKDRLASILLGFRQEYGYEFDTEDFISDITVSVPLFVKDGLLYKWCHKSMQEYFFAKYIWLDSGDDKEKYLNRIYESDNFDHYINVLALYYDMDFESLEKSIIRTLFTELANRRNALTKGFAVSNRVYETMMFFDLAIGEVPMETAKKLAEKGTYGIDTPLFRRQIQKNIPPSSGGRFGSRRPFSCFYSGPIIYTNNKTYFAVLVTKKGGSIGTSNYEKLLQMLASKKRYANRLTKGPVRRPEGGYVTCVLDGALSEQVEQSVSVGKPLVLDFESHEGQELLKTLYQTSNAENNLLLPHNHMDIQWDFIAGQLATIEKKLSRKEDYEF